MIYGLHLARFAGPGMRWGLFGFGVLGSLMIATGMVLWSVKRRQQAQRKGAAAPPLKRGERLVASLNVALLGGLPLATGVFLASNRLLPLDLKAAPMPSLACFFGAWGLALLIGIVRPDRWGWSVLLGLAGAVFAALPVLNAFTTHTHLGVTLPAGEWMWAGMDLSFLFTGALLGWMAWRLRPARGLQAAAAAHGRSAKDTGSTASPSTPSTPSTPAAGA